MLKLNLGSEDNVLDGFENLDPRWKQFSGVKPWDGWNTRIPYEDGSAELAVVQHVLMYLARENYDKNLQEIRRVLCLGGKLILKEEENCVYQWRKLGTKHRSGHIIGSTNLVLISSSICVKSIRWSSCQDAFNNSKLTTKRIDLRFH